VLAALSEPLHDHVDDAFGHLTVGGQLAAGDGDEAAVGPTMISLARDFDRLGCLLVQQAGRNPATRRRRRRVEALDREGLLAESEPGSWRRGG